MSISRSRMNRVLGEPPRRNMWEAAEHHAAIETVSRDPRPVRAVAGFIMTALATGGGLSGGIYIAHEIYLRFVSVAEALSSAL